MSLDGTQPLSPARRSPPTRYPAGPISDAVDAPALERFPNTVYQDGQVRILENPHAFPRAWIVHADRVVPESDKAVAIIASGQVDPRQTALLEDPPPALESPSDSSLDQALITTNAS